MKLVILIPAFNEEKTISDVIKSIGTSFPKINEIEVLVIDDGSTDKTADVARSCGALVYSFTQNKGLAKAISYGFSKARERKADILVILDADNQYDPNEIPLLLDPILEKKADIVLGDRKIMKLDHMPLQKKIGNKLSSRVVSKLMGQRINDAQTGFRAFNQDAINKLHIFSGYTYTQETLLQAKYKGLKILEVPVAFRRRNDKSRLISNIFTYAFRTISLIASTIIFYKSLKFFGILTVILFGIGVGLSVFLLNHFYTTGNISPYYPTTVLAAIFLITAAICTLMTIISLIMNRQSILLEEINQKLNKSTF